MTRIAIVTDSTASLPQELARRHAIHVLPTYISFGEQVFRDGVDLTPAEFYQRLQMSLTLPTTSQPSVGDFVELYTRLIQNAEGIVSIHVSQELSGTLDSARAARQILEDRARAGKHLHVPICILDSRSVAMGLGFIVLAAARAAMAGKSLPAVVQAAEALIPRMNVLFTVETLEYLHRGGRIGGAAALLGSVLSIKPILCIRNGRVEVLERMRTRRRARARLLEIMTERLGPAGEGHVAILHADAFEPAQGLAEEIKGRFKCAELHIADLCPVVGAHVGPGTLGLVFYAEE